MTTRRKESENEAVQRLNERDAGEETVNHEERRNMGEKRRKKRFVDPFCGLDDVGRPRELSLGRAIEDMEEREKRRRWAVKSSGRFPEDKRLRCERKERERERKMRRTCMNEKANE